MKPDGTPKSDTLPSHSSSLQFLFLDLDTPGEADAPTTYDYGLGMGELIHFPQAIQSRMYY